MRIEAYDDAISFAQVARPLLMREEALYCLPLGILDTLIHDPTRYPKAHLLAVLDDTQLVGIAWMTPPHPLGLTEMPTDAIAALARHASGLDDRLTAVVGPTSAVEQFTLAWLEISGDRVGTSMRQGVFELSRVAPAPPTPGAMRFTTDADRELMIEWSLEFTRDVSLPAERAEAVAMVDSALARGTRVLWEREGRAVSMAGFGGKTPSGIRVSYVYTPPELRRRGYASALVGALSQHLLDSGNRFCFLYTDLANPTSNHIYECLGYRRIGESTHRTFER